MEKGLKLIEVSTEKMETYNLKLKNFLSKPNSLESNK